MKIITTSSQSTPNKLNLFVGVNIVKNENRPLKNSILCGLSSNWLLSHISHGNESWTNNDFIKAYENQLNNTNWTVFFKAVKELRNGREVNLVGDGVSLKVIKKVIENKYKSVKVEL
jgi:hypothetical protein